MNWKVLAGAGALSLLMALSALVGSIALHTASADTIGSPQVGPAAQAATTPATTPGTKQGHPNGGFRGGAPGQGGPGFGGPGRGGPGFGGPGFGGPGFGGPGRPGGDGRGATTADGANRVISATNSLITLVKNDLTYATGKMDTTTAADWLGRAEGLVKTAQSAVTAGEFGKAVATTNAAGSLAHAADLLMQQALGADKLPSYNQNQRGGFPGGHHPGAPNATPAAPTQAQSSREMVSFYNEITRTAAELKAATNAGDAATYLTGAENRYSTAYTAYGAGKYSEAHDSIAVGRLLLEAAQSRLRATTAPNSPDTPVQVPAPNF